MRNLAVSAVMVAGLALYPRPSRADELYASLEASLGELISRSQISRGDSFGTSIAIDGDIAAVGAPGDDGDFPAPSAGSVYIFSRAGTSWQIQQIIHSPNAYASFGASLALENGRLLIGAPSRNVVHEYVFNGSQWVIRGPIYGSDVQSQDAYGTSLALRGTTLVVGAPRYEDPYPAPPNPRNGAIHVFTLQGDAWQPVARFAPYSEPQDERFGSAVVTDGEIIVAAAGMSRAVRVYRITPNGVLAEATLSEPGLPFGGRYGWSVAIDAGRVLVSAPYEEVAADRSGAVYEYAENAGAWTLRAHLTASAALPIRGFGVQLAAGAQTLLIAGDRETPEDPDAPRKAVVQRRERVEENWIERETLDVTRGDGSPWSEVSSLAFENAAILLGQRNWSGPAGYREGRAVAFEQFGSNWTQNEMEPGHGLLSSGDSFGGSAAIDGDTLVVGASHDTNHGGVFSQGSAYVFVRGPQGWSLQQKLISWYESIDYYGSRVDIDGNLIAILAPSEDRAYVYRRDGTTWSEEAALDARGWAVATHDDQVFVGDDDGSASGNWAGEVNVFGNGPGGWAHWQRLAPFDGAPSDGFGYSLATDGETLVVGAVHDSGDGRGSEHGSAYVFEYAGTGWVPGQKLVPSDTNAFDNVGVSVAVENDWIAIGAMGDGYAEGQQRGAVYLYRRHTGGWAETAKLTPPPGPGWGVFGVTVALSGGLLAIGDRADWTAITFYDLNPDGSWALRPSAPIASQYVLDLDGERMLLTSVNESLPPATECGNARVYSVRQCANAAVEVTWTHDAILCPGDTISATLPQTEIGAAYQLLADGAPIGIPQHGTGGPTTLSGVPTFGPGQTFVMAQVRATWIATGCERLLVDSDEPINVFASDLDGDSAVGVQDLAILLAHFGQTSDVTPQDGDLDGNGRVSLRDLAVMLASFGLACP